MEGSRRSATAGAIVLVASVIADQYVAAVQDYERQRNWQPVNLPEP